MNALLWILQSILALLLVANFLSTGPLIRRGMSRRPAVARMFSLGGLVLAAGIILPWATGAARFLTPIAATLLAALAVVDTVVNSLVETRGLKITRVDLVYNGLQVAMSMTVAIGRFADLR